MLVYDELVRIQMEAVATYLKVLARLAPARETDRENSRKTESIASSPAENRTGCLRPKV